jgi:hypothetical protein
MTIAAAPCEQFVLEGRASLVDNALEGDKSVSDFDRLFLSSFTGQ